MFKFLLILTILFYVVFKVGNFFFRMGAASQQFRNPPPPRTDKSKKASQIKGGEYVDYEEVK